MKHLCPKCNEVYETKDLLNYVHKQLHEQILAEKDEEIERLRRALARIESWPSGLTTYDMRLIAREVLERK